MTESERNNAIPEVAFRKGFHRMTANDMARECRAMLDACPTCEFEGLEAGKTYAFKPSYGTPSLVTVGQTTPKRPAGRRQCQPRGTAAHLQGRLTTAALSSLTPICAP